MSLRKNITVVPSDSPEPNQIKERVSLFNEDGSPFSSGGGSDPIKIYSLKHNKPAAPLWADNQFDSPASIRPIGFNQNNLRIDASGITEHYVHPDWEDDAGNGGGIALANFRTVYPNGGYFIVQYSWARVFETSIPGTQLGYNTLGVDLMGMSWIDGSDYTSVEYAGVLKTGSNQLSMSGTNFVQITDWGDDRLGVVAYGNSYTLLGSFPEISTPFTRAINLSVSFVAY